MSANESIEREFLKYLKNKYKVAKPASEPTPQAEAAVATSVVPAEPKKRGRKSKVAEAVQTASV